VPEAPYILAAEGYYARFSTSNDLFGFRAVDGEPLYREVILANGLDGSGVDFQSGTFYPCVFFRAA
jgi:hypothetical protein